MLCTQQNCFSHFRKNITCLHAGLLRIGQVLTVSYKTVYRRAMTIVISCAKCFRFVDLHYVCILQSLQKSWLICRAYYCIQRREMWRRTAWTSAVLLSSVIKVTGYGLEGQASIPGAVMIFSTPTFVPTPGLDISSPRHEMKGCVRIYAVVNKPPRKGHHGASQCSFSMTVKRKLNSPAGNWIHGYSACSYAAVHCAYWMSINVDKA
jgi:hypothetical protein